jgi:hypothetical protein
VNQIEELLRKLSGSTYKSDFNDAKARRICIACKEPARDFRDKGAEFEYSISAICEQYQDVYFKGR